MADYVTLLGAEDVRSAGTAIRCSAELMQRAASEIDAALGFTFANRLEEFASRIERALEPTTRKVKVFKVVNRQVGFDPHKRENVKIDDGEGTFHQWGMNYEEFDSGPGCFTTAIIEREDGTVQNVPAENIQFIP